MSQSVPATNSGLAVIRKALLQRRFKGHLNLIARDHGVGLAALEDFTYGNATLGPEVLNALAKELLGPNVTFDPLTDKLRRAKAPSTPLASARPEPVAGSQLPINTAGQQMPKSTEQPKPKTPPPVGANDERSLNMAKKQKKAKVKKTKAAASTKPSAKKVSRSK